MIHIENEAQMGNYFIPFHFSIGYVFSFLAQQCEIIT